jgi:hypothetical protein
MDEDTEDMTGDELAKVAEMAKHAQALGNVSLSWTRLHEVMAVLFGLLLRPAPEERAAKEGASPILASGRVRCDNSIPQHTALVEATKKIPGTETGSGPEAVVSDQPALLQQPYTVGSGNVSVSHWSILPRCEFLRS